VPKFGAGTSLADEAKEAAPLVQSTEEPIVVSKVPTVEPVETKVDRAEEPKIEEIMKMSEILSPPTEAKLPKVQKASAATHKRRRMANVLDAVLETTKALSPAPAKKVAEAAKAQAETETKQAKIEATKTQAKTEATTSAPAMTKPAAPGEKRQGRLLLKRSRLLLSKLQLKILTTSFDTLRGRNCPKMKSRKQDIILKN
jgi:hypothetical protein